MQVGVKARKQNIEVQLKSYQAKCYQQEIQRQNDLSTL